MAETRSFGRGNQAFYSARSIPVHRFPRDSGIVAVGRRPIAKSARCCQTQRAAPAILGLAARLLEWPLLEAQRAGLQPSTL